MHSFCRFVSKDDLILIIELAARLTTRCETNDAIYAALVKILPFQNFIACRVRRSATSHGLKHVFNLGYPKEWLTSYNKFGYHRIDPVVTTATEGLVRWDKIFKSVTPDQKYLIKEAAEYGLMEGFSVRHYDSDELRVTSFAGKAISTHPRHAAVIELISPYLQFASETPNPINCNLINLSDREMDVLHWVAAGKTNWEISCILRISERTVKFHLGNVMTKLNCNTRSQAVAKAFNCGILRL
ncbi:transcriptional regulator, LuxR family [Candidatus Paraburkholderia kirkii UZHbot1]|uniref:Transcriptional regulator, LuxR family n=1 Tax=Candidatus Paraburkholderia kirkii UZHbot1 TaxID=1055526 RepID=G4ME28_9BURK|nr:transcriptional regulator, LuxR family [Candidatus Paraburkholderia kirkii UZHbot1]